MRGIEQAIHQAARLAKAWPSPASAEMETRELAKALIDAFKEIDSRLLDIEAYLERLRNPEPLSSGRRVSKD